MPNQIWIPLTHLLVLSFSFRLFEVVSVFLTQLNTDYCVNWPF